MPHFFFNKCVSPRLEVESSGHAWLNGLLIRCVKLRVAHAPRMSGTSSLSPTSKETAS